jgi:hypothetical protein
VRLVLVTLTALILVPAASPAPLPRACSLLTAKQVAKVLGAKPEWHETKGDRRFQICTWHGPVISESTGAHPQLQLSIYATTKARFKAGENQTLTARPVKGTGEIAYFSGPGGEFLSVFARGYALQVSVFYTVSPLTKAKQAANAALGNL